MNAREWLVTVERQMIRRVNNLHGRLGDSEARESTHLALGALDEITALWMETRREE